MRRKWPNRYREFSSGEGDSDFQSAALPTELLGHCNRLIFIGYRIDADRAGARIRPALGAARQGRKTAILTRSTAVAPRAERRVLLASFPDRQTLVMVVPYSADLTIPVSLAHALLASPLTSAAMDDVANCIR